MATQRPIGHPPVKIYNAVYSSVQVWECMVRGIAVMRRRADSYVNATQILKVAGIEKGRRTKILEKEILPGKHEIVQGGYGKYQGTWIPLERGRDLATQYGVASLLSPLFDYHPNSAGIQNLPSSLHNPSMLPQQRVPAPPSSLPSFSAFGYPPASQTPHNLAPAPILPGSALKLLNQGRAQGLFTPSASHPQQPIPSHVAPLTFDPHSRAARDAIAVASSLKRTRTDEEPEQSNRHARHPPLPDNSRERSLVESPTRLEQSDGLPSPSKRPRMDWPERSQSNGMHIDSVLIESHPETRSTSNGVEIDRAILVPRSATKPIGGSGDRMAPLRSSRRNSIVNIILQQDSPQAVLELLLSQSTDTAADIDLILDDQGHTALHLAASLARLACCEALVKRGADVHRGNHCGETPLIRAVLSSHNYDAQTFPSLVNLLHQSIRTLDNSRRTVAHHAAHVAGVKGRAACARYYLENILLAVARRQGGDFTSLVDLQDEHGDTALNIAARVGNRGIVKLLIDVGANRSLANKLGLRPGDFGVDGDELLTPQRADDIVSSLRSGPSMPVQKSQDVIADLTLMIQSLSADFNAEVKTKQENLDLTQAHLRAATRELADQRKQIQHWQSKCNELEQVQQRVRNLERALKEEENFDWSGRTEIDGSPASKDAGLAFQYWGPNSMFNLGSLEIPINLDVDPPFPLPTTDSTSSFIRLQRLNAWHARIEKLMRDRLASLQGASAEKEFQYRRIISLCCGVPPEEVDKLIDPLVTALESDGVVDFLRVSGFMRKVKEGEI